MFPYDKNKIRNAFEQPAPCLPLSFASCCPQRPGLSILSICLAPASLPTNLTSHDVEMDYPVCGCSWVFIFLTIKPLFKDLVCRCGSVVKCLACSHPSPLHKGCMVIHIIFPTLERQSQESREFKVILDYIASLRLVWGICDLPSIHPSTSQSPKVMEFNQAVGNNMFIIFEPVTSTLWNLS